MTIEPDTITTITVDSYGTLVDVEATTQRLAKYTDNPTAIANVWRTQSLEYTFIASAIDAYKPFYEINRDALEYALNVYDVSTSKDERDEILASYHELDVFDDVRKGLSRLAEAGYDCYVLSNGNPAMLSSMVDQADIGDIIEDTISADEIKTFKPNVGIYRYAAARTGTPIEEIAHVTAGWADVLGGMHAGMQGVWVNRDDDPWHSFGGDPDMEVSSFLELSEAMRE
ncbi:MAG: haloacid dehalogenase type II [Halobacteriaceae archaeon]